MTASYSTIPADVDSSAEPLLNNKPKFSLKRVVGAAAVVSFCLGAVAAASLSSPRAPIKKLANFEEEPYWQQILDHGYCAQPFNPDAGEKPNFVNPWKDQAGDGSPLMCDQNGGQYDPNVSFMSSISCTPYAYAPDDGGWDGIYDDDAWHSQGEQDAFAEYALLGDPAGAGAWGVVGQEPDEFFVFHGADRSGTQPDCAGEDFWWAERFGPTFDPDQARAINPDVNLNGDGKIEEWVNGGADFNDVMPADGICWDQSFDSGHADRHYCSFVHPGTKTFYTDYLSGWASREKTTGGDIHQVDYWTWQPDGFTPSNPEVYQEGDCGDMGSAFSGCWNKKYREEQVLPEVTGPMNKLYKKHGDRFFSFMLYPWVCVGVDGAEENFFSWPTVPNTNMKCYADNEVGVGPGYPPYMNFYYGYFDVSSGNKVMYLNLRSFGPDGNLIDQYDNKVFKPVTDDGDPRVW